MRKRLPTTGLQPMLFWAITKDSTLRCILYSLLLEDKLYFLDTMQTPVAVTSFNTCSGLVTS